MIGVEVAADTDAARALFLEGRISSATAMVYMADSERAATQAALLRLPVGLHINLTEAFSAPGVPPVVRRDQERLARYLNASGLAHGLYNPLLHRACLRMVAAQLEEFRRLYNSEPSHFDGHEHMHLCANMLVGLPIPKGSRVRPSASYQPRERGLINRTYRALINRWMHRFYVHVDCFFDLSQRMAPGEFARVCTLARQTHIELMCHPARTAETAFLRSSSFLAGLREVQLASYLDMPGGPR